MWKSKISVFWALVIVFLFIMAEFFVPAVREFFRGPLFLVILVIFCLLGGLLIYLTIKEETEKKLKIFLLLMGASAAGLLFFAFLHNIFYALAELSGQIVLLNFLLETFHASFFFVAVIACPLGFLVGVTGSLVILIKKPRIKKIKEILNNKK